MQRVVGIVFNKKSRIYNFDAVDFSLEENDCVIVETEKGLQYGYVVTDVKEFNEDNLSLPLRPVLRLATKRDTDIHKKNIADSQKALEKAKELAQELNLEMRLLDASFTFDRRQLLFNFLADERIDFRELVKKLAQLYKTRIELRQIGIRDKAKEIGGLGPCGRMLCCNTFLTDLNSVTINMAKNQLLALNPTKINGVCGRLLCCLNYEDAVYTKLRENMPEVGEYYKDSKYDGRVINCDVLKRKITIQDKDGNTNEVYLDNGSN